MKNLAIIQARIGSSRLPGKVLLPLEDKPVLEHVIHRVKQSRFVSDLLVATTTANEELDIIKLCHRLKVKVFCGAENNVLERFYQAALLLNPDNIIRITADCPVADPEIIGQVIKEHLNSGADYTANVIKETYPDGLDIEVFKFTALKTARKKAQFPSEQEHVTPYIRNNPENFRLHNVEAEKNYAGLRWTLDYPQDYEFLKIIYKNLYSENNFFGMREIIHFLKDNPEVQQLNHNIERNEAYIRLLALEKRDNIQIN